jgi:4-hydroxybenzoate polyprenyltransferase
MRLRHYAQLVRLPNVFTALADICLGALVTGALPARWLPFGLLLLASACLYSGGMVWNDLFDLEQDRRERPFRPLPSGKVTLNAAVLLGVLLLGAGGGLAWLAGWLHGAATTTAVLAGCLIAAILLYDGWLKRTWAGPVGMGACRFLNVLLGLSLAEEPRWQLGVYLALVVGVYIVGVTWFARKEAQASNPALLAGAAAVMLAGLLLCLPVPVFLAETPWPHTTSVVFPYLVVAFGFLIGIPVWRAITRPAPDRVQAAVKQAVLGLVALDAILATAAVGWYGLLLLLLLLPALYLGRWLYST